LLLYGKINISIQINYLECGGWMIRRNLMNKQILKQYNFVGFNLNFARLGLIVQDSGIIIEIK